MGCDQHSRRAIAALQRIALTEGILQISDLPAVRQALNRLHQRGLSLHRKHQARAHNVSIHTHGASTANAVLTANMCPRQAQMLTEKIRKIEPRQDVSLDRLAIDLQRDRHGSCHATPPLAFNSGRRSSVATQRAASIFARWRRIAAEAC